MRGANSTTVLEDAMWEHLKSKAWARTFDPEVMAHFYASLEKNRRLYDAESRSDPRLAPQSFEVVATHDVLVQ